MRRGALQHSFEVAGGYNAEYNANVVYPNLNLVLHRGERVALVSPNGAGKTTLLKILDGVLPFEKGEQKTGP